MPRLVVSPGTPKAWEIKLKPGINLLGRGHTNDFKFEDPSVSASHCQIVVSENSTTITDLDSTNGTFVNHTAVREAQLEPGQVVRLGSVEMAFYTDTPPPAAAAPAPPPGLRIAGRSAAPPPVVEQPPVAALPEERAVEAVPGSPPPERRVCKFHPKSPARYLCRKCNRAFCERCVISRKAGATTKKLCRTCGVECMPLEETPNPPTKGKGFLSSLRSALKFPSKGSNLFILLVGTLLGCG